MKRDTWAKCCAAVGVLLMCFGVAALTGAKGMTLPVLATLLVAGVIGAMEPPHGR